MDQTFSHVSGSIELAPGVVAPTAAVRIQFARSSGPGGQNVNKLNTKAELWVPIEAIIGLTNLPAPRLTENVSET